MFILVEFYVFLVSFLNFGTSNLFVFILGSNMMKDRVFKQKNGLRCMIKACLRRKILPYLCADLIQLYVLIWCTFMRRFSTNLCSDLGQFYVVPFAINRGAIRLV